MSLQRKLIRHATAELLKNNTAAQDRVFAGRAVTVWGGFELPAICVYGERETVEVFNESPREYLRTLELRVEILAAGDNADDQVDDIGDRVERLIGRSDRLTYAKEPLVSDIQLSSEQTEFRSDGEQVVYALIITYSAQYRTFEPDEFSPEPIDDLHTVATDYSLDGKQAPADRARDLVTGLDDAN